MCIPCCNNCYTKYLSEDYQLDKESMDKVFGEGWKVFEKLPNTYHIETSNGNVEKFCTCRCHVKNSCVMH